MRCSVPVGLDSVLPCGVGSTLSFCIQKGVAPFRINNKKELSQMKKYLQCKDCTRVFTFTEENQEDFRKRNWPDPIRCMRCIQRTKERRKDPYWGWEATMGSGVSVKKRHHRVNYPVHVVGGFR